jgi:hypothetical protein
MNILKIKSLQWFLIAAAAIVMAGCAGAPGRTAKQVNQNHDYVIRTNWLMIQDDIDKALLLDKPSRQTEMIIR